MPTAVYEAVASLCWLYVVSHGVAALLTLSPWRPLWELLLTAAVVGFTLWAMTHWYYWAMDLREEDDG